MNDELKAGDWVIFEMNEKNSEGRFIGYLFGTDENHHDVGVIEYYSYMTGTQLISTRFFRKKPEPKKRLMTAKELAGKWIKGIASKNECSGVLVVGFNSTQVRVFGFDHPLDIRKEWLYTSTPSDDSSWKSVEVDE